MKLPTFIHEDRFEKSLSGLHKNWRRADDVLRAVEWQLVREVQRGHDFSHFPSVGLTGSKAEIFALKTTGAPDAPSLIVLFFVNAARTQVTLLDVREADETA